MDPGTDRLLGRRCHFATCPKERKRECSAPGCGFEWAALPADRTETLFRGSVPANVLDKLPKKVQPSAKRMIHQMYMVFDHEAQTRMAPTKAAALRLCSGQALEAYGEFLALYGAKYPKACECLRTDQDVLFTFYDFPAEHWRHIRTTNPIESTFATIRPRSRQTKGCGSRSASLAMVFKLSREAEKSWRRLNGYELMDKVIRGVRFQDGVEKKEAA